MDPLQLRTFWVAGASVRRFALRFRVRTWTSQLRSRARSSFKPASCAMQDDEEREASAKGELEAGHVSRAPSSQPGAFRSPGSDQRAVKCGTWSSMTIAGRGEELWSC